jgi:steroid delta-isomerase-like uncharacterized protein
MSGEDLKAQVRRLIEEGWNTGNMAVFDELYAANVAYHNPLNPQKGRAGVKSFCTATRAAYPDWRFIIDDLMAAEGDKVVTRFTEVATDTGGSPPTGKHLTMTGIAIWKFEGGKVVEEWLEVDFMGMQRQLQG